MNLMIQTAVISDPSLLLPVLTRRHPAAVLRRLVPCLSGGRIVHNRELLPVHLRDAELDDLIEGRLV